LAFREHWEENSMMIGKSFVIRENGGQNEHYIRGVDERGGLGVSMDADDEQSQIIYSGEVELST